MRLPGRAQPSAMFYLPSSSLPWAAAAPGILEPPPRKKPAAEGSIRPVMEGTKDGASPQAGSPPPCSTMQGAVCRTGVPGTSRQGKEAGASLDQVGTLSTSDQRTVPVSV